MNACIKTAGRSVTRAGRPAIVIVAFLALLLSACTTPGPDGGTLGQLKRSHFGQLAQSEAALIGAGLAQPVVEFTVENTPPSIFVNWTIPDAQAAAFTTAIALPPSFSLAKVRILESDPVPRYWLSLNVYRVSGITTGLRAEWSTYVDDGSGAPRFMIVRARAAGGSIDPIGPLAQPEPFSHSLDPGDVINTSMNRTEEGPTGPVITPDHLFSSSITLPDEVDRDFVEPTREWVTANDFIYWINGVNDRTFYNAKAHSAPMISVDMADVTLDDDTEWAPFLDPTPAHVLVYLDELQFVIGPWWNVTEPDGHVDPGTRSNLLGLKKTMYGGLANIAALNVQSGNAQPLVRSTVEDSPPSVDWHWRIAPSELAAFEAAAGLPAGLSLAPVKLQEGDATAEHWLSLNVARVSGAESGLRAEWTTYVDDGSSIRTLILEARADHPSVDPVNRSTDPYPVTHSLAADMIDTTVGSAPSQFSSSLTVPAPGSETTVLASRDYATANEFRYWGNGIADRVFRDGGVFQPKVSIDPGTVTSSDDGQWAQFVASTPDRVWVSPEGSGLVTNPWFNLYGG